MSRSFTLASAFSCLLLGIVLVLWIGSYIWPAQIPNQFLDVSDTFRSSRGRFSLTFRAAMEPGKMQLPSTFAGEIGPNVAIYAQPSRQRAGIQWQTGYATAGPVDMQARQFTPQAWRSIVIPYAYLATITGILPLCWGTGALRRRLRRQLNLCPHCRQDLRHSKTCCPRCGQPIHAGA